MKSILSLALIVGGVLGFAIRAQAKTSSKQ